MVTLNLNWFQIFYCMCPSENFITTLLVTYKMVDSKKQEIQKIISLSVILHYVHLCHPNFKNVVKIQDHVWLRKLHIFQNYTFLVTLMAWLLFKKTQGSKQNSQNRRSGGKANHIYETYKNTVMTHGRHIYAKAYDMEKSTMCAYPQ